MKDIMRSAIYHNRDNKLKQLLSKSHKDYECKI